MYPTRSQWLKEAAEQSDYISTDHVRIPFRAKVVVMKLCQRHSGICSCRLCIFTRPWGGRGTVVGAIKISVTGVGLLQSAMGTYWESWRSYNDDSVLRLAALEAAGWEAC